MDKIWWNEQRMGWPVGSSGGAYGERKLLEELLDRLEGEGRSPGRAVY
jgi:hypothetical protein